MRFEVLGPTRAIRVRVGGRGRPEGADAATGDLIVLGGPKQRLVLALLLAGPNRVISVDQLIDGVWGDNPPDSSRHTVQSYVSELRKALGPVIERVGAGYRIEADAENLDTLEFESLVAEARNCMERDPELALDLSNAALGLWRGAPFGELGDMPVLHAQSVRLLELKQVAVETSLDARLRVGRHTEAVAELERLTREHPYREELRALHMIALYRSGRQADALRAYRATREVLADELGLEPSPRLRRLEEQILLQDPDLDAPGGSGDATGSGSEPDGSLDNPYVGLRAFHEADHARFFGQDLLVDRLLERVTGHSGFTAVVGPSGSGKSSAVRAGLIPRLRGARPDDRITVMQPGTRPFAALAAALAEVVDRDERDVAMTLERPDGLAASTGEVAQERRRRLVVVIDQFEELFTLVDETESRRFLDLLAQGVRDEPDAVRVVVTLRADFYDRPLTEPRFGRLFADNVVTVAALGPDELAAAATLPARQLDIEIEPRLVGRLVADVAGQPNALPLFQYALTELFEARNGSMLDVGTYERIGGVRRAVARRAESLYTQLDPTEQEVARQLFLRIATVSGELVGRRRVPASELASLGLDNVAMRNVIEVYARHRLLVIDRDPVLRASTVEVAHEALLSEWHRLREWIDRHREDLARQATFLSAIEEWETSGRDPGYLLRGTRLTAYLAWAQSTHLRLTSTEQEFLDAAIGVSEAETLEEQRREHQRLRLQRRARRQLAGLFVAAAVFTGLVAYPFVSGTDDAGRIVVVLPGRSGSGEFEELIMRGSEAAGDAHGYAVDLVEPPFTDTDADIRSAVDGASVVVANSVSAELLLPIVGDYPETTFALLDMPFDPEFDNVVRVDAAAEQGSFLVGAAAALESTTGRLGYIGANPTAPIEAFRAGFEQGARSVDPDVEIIAALIEKEENSGYDRPDLAADIAAEMFADDVDVIYSPSGGSRFGVLDAAAANTADHHAYVIGVDSDLWFDVGPELRDHVLTSMFKSTEVGIQAVVAAHAAGELEGSGQFFVGLADGAVGYTTSGDHLSDATIERLESIREGIVGGEFVIDDEPDEVWDIDLSTGFVRLRLDDGATTSVDAPFDDVAHVMTSPRSAPGTVWWLSGDELVVGSVDSTGEVAGRDSLRLTSPDGWSGSEERGWDGGGLAPDGTSAVLQESGLGAVGRLVLHDLESGDSAVLVDLSDQFRFVDWLAPVFSSDGDHILYQLQHDEGPAFDVWSVSVAGGSPELELADAAFPIPLGDGRVAVVRGLVGLIGDQTATISIVDTEGRMTDVAEVDHAPLHLVASPDLTHLAYVEQHGTGPRVRVIDVTSGENRIVGFGDSVEWLDADFLLVARAGWMSE